VTGRGYLEATVKFLESHPQPPRDVKIGAGGTYAGMVFDRLSLRRAWEDGQIGMTYWVTVKKGYVLSLVGCYGQPDGRQQIELLLGEMTPDHGP
jgi:hypothetical protein